MHKITHRRLNIEFEVWEPFEKMVNSEIQELTDRIRTREFLGHTGKLKIIDTDEFIDQFESNKNKS